MKAMLVILSLLLVGACDPDLSHIKVYKCSSELEALVRKYEGEIVKAIPASSEEFNDFCALTCEDMGEVLKAIYKAKEKGKK